VETLNALKSLCSSLTVLYIEDEDAIRESIQRYLQKLFAKVDVAQDGEKGVELYQKKGPYDIIITDIKMPVMNGLEMLSEIKALNPEQDVIIISAYQEPIYFLEAIKLEVDGYIIKPVNFDQMNHTLFKVANKILKFKENTLYQEKLEDMIKNRTQAILKLEEEKIDNFEHTLMALVKLIEDRDTYTGGHS
jgi:YesN/AraC family two-component response regulator